MNAVDEYIISQRDRYTEALRRLVAQPSVTTDLDDCRACADLLAEIMREAGCPPSIEPPAEGASPILVHRAEALDREARTLIGYAHYDVKPIEPREAWTHDPWGATVVDGTMYGRGVVDNKSGCLAFVFALEAYKRIAGHPPCNLTLLFEGEEETGSEHLEAWALANRDRIEGADGLHCLDGSVEAATQRPRILLHGRGMIYVDLVVQGPVTDVHSGRAALVQNPVWRLVGALATIKDPKTDAILIDGWNDHLAPIDEDERAYFDEQMLTFDEAKIQTQFGTEGRPFPGNRKGIDLLAAYHREPTANICGIQAGFATPGKMQTIVPSSAIAKLDFRCPPNLDPTILVHKLREHLDNHGYQDVEMRVLFAGGYPWRAAYGAAITRACYAASEEVFGEPPAYVGPTAPEGIFPHHFGIPPILTGFGGTGANIHAPDERLSIDRFILGIRYAAAIMRHFATVEASS